MCRSSRALRARNLRHTLQYLRDAALVALSTHTRTRCKDACNPALERRRRVLRQSWPRSCQNGRSMKMVVLAMKYCPATEAKAALQPQLQLLPLLLLLRQHLLEPPPQPWHGRGAPAMCTDVERSPILRMPAGRPHCVQVPSTHHAWRWCYHRLPRRCSGRQAHAQHRLLSAASGSAQETRREKALDRGSLLVAKQ